MDKIICRKCGKPFETEECKCPYDKDMEDQLRDERNKIKDSSYNKNADRESKTKSIFVSRGGYKGRVHN